MKQAFLVNPARRRRARKSTRKGSGVATVTRKTSRRRTSARRKGVPQWVRDKGYSSWGAYMASIRPGTKGGKVARRRRRRASASRPVARRRRRRSYRRNTPVAYAANPRRRSRRRTYRRNPISARGLMGKVTQAGTAAIGVLAGKAGARVGRSAMRIVGGTPIGYLAEVAVGIAGGMVLEKFVSRNFAASFLVGALVSVGEQIAKNANIPIVSAALGDEGEGLLSLVGDDMSQYLVGGYDAITGGGREVGSYDIGAYEQAEA